jgi:SAM-dependent methyltransferase
MMEYLQNNHLLQIITRTPIPEPWEEAEKIPWDDPEFSRRMLREHLNQKHDRASRKFETITQHVSWIDQEILRGKPSQILDLGCGPGLYIQRLARLGHRCSGIDFSPASVAYAQKMLLESNVAGTVFLADIRQADFAKDFNLVMFIFGELNAFTRHDASLILRKSWTALVKGGTLLLEVSSFNSIRNIGQQPPTWFSQEQGLFSDSAYICLMENFWNEDHAIAIERFFVIDATSGSVTRMTSSLKAYQDAEYLNLLREVGFTDVIIYPNLGMTTNNRGEFIAITGKK